MESRRFITGTVVAMSLLGAGSVRAAEDPSSWVPIRQAVLTAQAWFSNSTPIKAEVDPLGGAFAYEVKTFAGNTVYEIHIDPETGVVFDIDASSGGGAQDLIAEAQFVISQSAFTLVEAIDFIQDMFPNHFLTDIEMENRDGVAIFDMDLVRGPYILEIRMRASDGVILRQSTHLLSGTSAFRNLYVPDVSPAINTSVLKKPQEVITAAQQRFGARAFEIELDQVTNTVYRYELRLLKGNRVIKAKYNARTGTYLSSSLVTDAQYVGRVQTAMSATTLTLKQAIAKAKTVVPGGFPLEAELRLQNNGRLYNVEFLTNSGIVEVKVNSTTGAIASIQFQD